MKKLPETKTYGIESVMIHDSEEYLKSMGKEMIHLVTPIDYGTMPIDNNPTDINFEYYYRRGNRLYFRSTHKKISFTIESIPKQIKRGNKYLLKIE